MSLKRKAAHGSLAHADTPDNKRRRGTDVSDHQKSLKKTLPNNFLRALAGCASGDRESEGFLSTQSFANVPETPQRTLQVGLEFLDRLKASKDKQEHRIASHFLTLPDPNVLPDYYQVIQLPIALDSIERKLRGFEYATISMLEADLKRMISNAKQYNEKNSEVHNDAEKIRKLVSNQFKELNPAYADPSYQALPTPLPGEAGSRSLQQVFHRPVEPSTPTPAFTEPAQGNDKPKRALNLRGPKGPVAAEISTPVAPTPALKGPFAGKTFQQAQEEILQELCELKNKEGDLIAGNFMQLPSRALKDYYQTIKHPESLQGLKKKAVGKQGHAEPTGISFFRTWGDFEHHVGYIWRNARQYNEDGSEISNLAGELERYFNKRLAEAKAVIPDPYKPSKVKLNMPGKSPEPAAPAQKITLNVQPRASPGGVAVDTEALKRRQDMIRSASAVSAAPERASSGIPEARMQMPPAAGISPTLPIAAGSIKHEVSTPGLPAVAPPAAVPEMNGGLPNGHVQPHMGAGMPPPSMAPRAASGSPFMPAAPYHASHSTAAFDQRLRAQGKTAADALITSLNVRSHPSLQHLPEEDRFDYVFQPSDRLTQQSFTFSLSAAHTYIRVQPSVQQQAATLRTTKLGVNLQGHKVNTVQQQYGQQLSDHDPRRPCYDMPLQEGVINRIEVWMLAGPARGAPKVGSGQEVEFEKYTLFIQRARA